MHLERTNKSGAGVTSGPGGVLPVMWREPLSERLLYTLGLASVDAGTFQLPPVYPAPIGPSEREAAFDRNAWLTAWRAVWSSYAAWDPAAPDAVPPADDPFDLNELVKRASGEPRFADAAFRQWVEQLPMGPRTGVIPEAVGEATARANGRGLRGIFVIPVAGAWSRIELDRILLVSQELVDNQEALTATVNSFGGASGNR